MSVSSIYPCLGKMISNCFLLLCCLTLCKSYAYNNKAKKVPVVTTKQKVSSKDDLCINLDAFDFLTDLCFDVTSVLGLARPRY